MRPDYRLALALAGLIAGSSLRADEPGPGFTPTTGFGGHSEGTGTLRVLFGRPHPFHVESYGTERPDGAFQLDQVVTSPGRRTLSRSWVITTVGPGRYTGSLSDAAGPVEGRTDGRRLFLRYRYAGPLVVHQTLELSRDGRTIDNAGRMTLLGIPVGRLRETITRTD